MKTNKTRSICMYTCTIYTYMHHQIPPKYNIYLVDLLSVLYETPGHNERSVLNQMFLLLFSEKRSFMKSAALFSEKQNSMKSAVLFNEKRNTFQWKVQLHEKRSAFQGKALKSATLFIENRSTFQQNFMRFWVITKYRSFVYIYERPNMSFLNAIISSIVIKFCAIASAELKIFNFF